MPFRYNTVKKEKVVAQRSAETAKLKTTAERSSTEEPHYVPMVVEKGHLVPDVVSHAVPEKTPDLTTPRKNLEKNRSISVKAVAQEPVAVENKETAANDLQVPAKLQRKIAKNAPEDAKDEIATLLYIILVLLLILIILGLVKAIVGPVLWSLIVLVVVVFLLGMLLGWW